MDTRTVKTQKAIKAAFLKLREQKPLEKITVKELCQLAQINKSTFYCYYDDIYALSDNLEEEMVQYILNDILQGEGQDLETPESIARQICKTCIAHLKVTHSLFSGQDNGRLAARLESGIKEILYQKYPAYRNDPQMDVLLSFCIQGAHHAYLSNQHVDVQIVMQTIVKIIKTLGPLY